MLVTCAAVLPEAEKELKRYTGYYENVEPDLETIF